MIKVKENSYFVVDRPFDEVYAVIEDARNENEAVSKMYAHYGELGINDKQLEVKPAKTMLNQYRFKVRKDTELI